MQSLAGYDHWKTNAPESPTHGECSACGEIKDHGDMTACGQASQVDICYDCIEQIVDDFPPEQQRRVESIIKRFGETDRGEIQEILGE